MQNQQKTIRERVETLFGLPAMKMPWSLYIAQLNEAGKLTARSIMDIMTVVLTSLEEQEQKIKDIELLTQRIETVEPIVTISEPAKEEPTLQEKVTKVTEKIVDKGLVDAILGDKPPEPKL